MNLRRQARPALRRRAFSLVELTAVVAILAIVATATIGRFCFGTTQNLAAEGYVRKLATDLAQARRRTIATGKNHYLLMSVSSGAVTSYTLYKDAGASDTVADSPRATPAGVTVATSHTTLEYDFDGSTLAAYTVTVTAPNRTWTVSTTMATGAVTTTSTP